MTCTSRCPLAGEHQVENAVTAAIALTVWACPIGAIETGIARRPAGRAVWSASRERPEIILDGAHNPAGARALAAYIDRFYAGRRVRLIYGAMRDKAVAEIGGILFPQGAAGDRHRAAPGARARCRKRSRDLADHRQLRAGAALDEALELVRDAAADDAIFITGSLFLVAEARAAGVARVNSHRLL